MVLFNYLLKNANNQLFQTNFAIEMVALRYYSQSRATKTFLHVKQLDGLFEQSTPRIAVSLLTFMLQDINCKRLLAALPDSL